MNRLEEVEQILKRAKELYEKVHPQSVEFARSMYEMGFLYGSSAPETAEERWRQANALFAILTPQSFMYANCLISLGVLLSRERAEDTVNCWLKLAMYT